MRIARLILAGLFGGCFGFAIVQLFAGHLEIGLGVLAIGLFLSIWYVISWIVDK